MPSQTIKTPVDNFTLRFAGTEDTSVILNFIKELAAYEKMSHEVKTDEKLLKYSLFERKAAEVIIGEYDNKPVAFALFFHNFSTFLGKPGIYLEDIYVQPDHRNKGIGKIMLAFLAKLAKERDCGRMEWWCLDWNSKSIEFYEKCGAEPMNDWIVYRLSGYSLSSLAEEFS